MLCAEVQTYSHEALAREFVLLHSNANNLSVRQIQLVYSHIHNLRVHAPLFDLLLLHKVKFANRQFIF